jgi:hypothetical protein
MKAPIRILDVIENQRGTCHRPALTAGVARARCTSSFAHESGTRFAAANLYFGN